MYLPIPQAKGLAAHYQDGLKTGQIRLQSCVTCQTTWHYPRPACPGCGSRSYQWIMASGTGIINTFTIVHHAPTPELKSETPYVVAMIDLEEGARMTGTVIGMAPLDCQIGDPVIIEIPTSEAGEPGMPVFRSAP
ncbi:MAG: OB-fold domain-containing protein [Sneathiella sp.]|nr:OB-fold domain-containing protein [Sneathiella sp.]